MKFVSAFKKTAEGLGSMINANIKKVVGPTAPRPQAPAAPASPMGQALGSIRRAFGGG